MKLELVVKTDFSHVELLKDEKNLLGIKIKGAKKDGATIKKIKPKSPAGRSFAITQGDIVLSVNGRSTTGKNHKDVRQMIRDAEPRVSLVLQYKRQEMKLGISSIGVYRKQRLTIRLQKANDTFGFILRKTSSTEKGYCIEYPVISSIKEGSQAYKSNQLQDGDRLISVDHLNLSCLCLDDIATFLEDKYEAEFTFEYNVRVADFTELEQKLDLEIDVPVSDLGLNFCMHTDATMYISNIRIGSIAERCGVFSEGDVILSINGIETNFLTPRKADFLLRNSKKIRKISVLKTKRTETVIAISELDQTEISSIATTETDITTTGTTTSGIGTTDWKHVNTPASSNIAFSVQQNYYSQKFCHSEQMEAIDKFQSMVPVMFGLKHQLSRLAQEAVNAEQSMPNENCPLCDKTQHSINVCPSCLTKMNNKCSQFMNLLKSIIVQFVDSSTNSRSISPRSVIGMEGRGSPDNQSTRFSVRSLVTALTETLPKAFHRLPELKQTFEDLAEKVQNADASCSTCDFEVKSVMLIVQKLLLLFSLRDNSHEIVGSIELLVGCLLETKFTCDGRYEHSVGDDNCSISTSENLSGGKILETDASSSLGVSSDLHNSAGIVPREIEGSSESVTHGPRPNTNTNLDYLKIAYVESVSESQNSIFVNEVDKANPDNISVIESITVTDFQRSSTPITPKQQVGNTDKKNHKTCSGVGFEPNQHRPLKRLEMPQKVNRYRDSFLRTRKTTEIQTAIQNGCENKPKVTRSGGRNCIPGTSSNIQNLSTSREELAIEGESIPGSDGNSTSENLSGEKILETDASSSLGVSSDLHNSAGIVPSEIEGSSESITSGPRPNSITNLDYLKIAHIRSVSESQNSIFVNEVDKANPDNFSFIESITVTDFQRSSTPITPKQQVGSTDKKDHEGKGLEMPRKVNRYRDSFLRTKKTAGIQTAVQNGCENKPKVTRSGGRNCIPGTSSNIQNLSTSRDELAIEGESISGSDGNSTRSSSRLSLKNESNYGRKKVRTETLEVKLTNDGDGFGVGISLQFIEDTAAVMPVIHAVKSNSPSYKTGIIQVDDRVIAINHQSTLGLNAKDLTRLKDAAFSADSVILTIEFDVIDEEPKFGTFDIILDRTLKTGLIFEAMKKGSPMVVSGVLKGSAAHRCGQLFAGDKILGIKCNRNENFDPITCNYERKVNVRVTVQRDQSRSIIAKKKSVNVSPYYINPCFNHEDFVPRNGASFVVKRRAIRAVENSEALVFELEVTLFRDTTHWDFGFLVGESRETGRAYVVDIRPGSPAHQSGVIKKFDKIVKVNGMLVERNVKNSVLVLLSQANDTVDLLLRRMYHEGSQRT